MSKPFIDLQFIRLFIISTEEQSVQETLAFSEARSAVSSACQTKLQVQNTQWIIHHLTLSSQVSNCFLFVYPRCSIEDSSNQCNCWWLCDSIQCLLTITATINAQRSHPSAVTVKYYSCMPRGEKLFYLKIYPIIAKVSKGSSLSILHQAYVMFYEGISLFKKEGCILECWYTVYNRKKAFINRLHSN